MSEAAFASAIAKLESVNLTDEEIDSLSEVLAAKIALDNDGEVQGFASQKPAPHDFSLNYETIKVTLRNPGKVLPQMGTNWSWGMSQSG